MTAIELQALLDRVEVEFEALLLAIHLAPLDSRTRGELDKDLFHALDHASAQAQLAAIARVRDAFVVAVATGGESQPPRGKEGEPARKEHPNS
jgi:hypothetical protein